MSAMRLLSWNVNGIRAIEKKGFVDWLRAEKPEILCIQETKAHEAQLSKELREIEGYTAFYASGERKGYSGVAIYSAVPPMTIRNGFGVPRFDNEGRTIFAEYESFILYNIYFPNGKASAERLAYKMEFYEAFLDHVGALKDQGKKIIICGDVNTAHKEIDLARPKENEKVSGFLPEERAWMDKFIARGFVDTFRQFNGEPGQYSWWDYKTRARDRNIGWRIDYFFVTENMRSQLSSAFILSQVMGSDHCPIGIELMVE